MTDRVCRNCDAPLSVTFADLGMSPLSNAFVPPERARGMEPTYPLHAFVCGRCKLVQLEAVETPEHIFSDYLYFSSFSPSWLRHAETYAARVVQRFGLGPGHVAVEIASNDGYLLRYLQQHGLRVLGVEPAANVAAVARSKGVPSEVAFFGRETAERLLGRGDGADLITANNVLAHVPDMHDFVAGFTILLKAQGVVTFEFPHLLRQMRETQFDTIYHEHFGYLSLHVVRRVLERHRLRVFDTEELPTHGGSLRVYVCHRDANHGDQPAVARAWRRDVGGAGG